MVVKIRTEVEKKISNEVIGVMIGWDVSQLSTEVYYIDITVVEKDF